MKTNQANVEAGKTNLGTAISKTCLKCAKAIYGQIQSARETILTEAWETLEVQDRLLHLAVNEAEALAWQTQYPQLFFPALAAEKIQRAAHWSYRQQLLA